jgi:hypothetical protein
MQGGTHHFDDLNALMHAYVEEPRAQRASFVGLGVFSWNDDEGSDGLYCDPDVLALADSLDERERESAMQAVVLTTDEELEEPKGEADKKKAPRAMSAELLDDLFDGLWEEMVEQRKQHIRKRYRLNDAAL